MKRIDGQCGTAKQTANKNKIILFLIADCLLRRVSEPLLIGLFFSFVGYGRGSRQCSAKRREQQHQSTPMSEWAPTQRERSWLWVDLSWIWLNGINEINEMKTKQRINPINQQAEHQGRHRPRQAPSAPSSFHSPATSVIEKKKRAEWEESEGLPGGPNKPNFISWNWRALRSNNSIFHPHQSTTNSTQTKKVWFCWLVCWIGWVDWKKRVVLLRHLLFHLSILIAAPFPLRSKQMEENERKLYFNEILFVDC